MSILILVLILLTNLLAEKVESAPRVINGTFAQPRMFPFAVALLNNKRQVFCTGSLLTDKLVLTAAHCIAYFQMYVLAGDIMINGASKSRQLRHVGETKRHPYFEQRRQQSFDIGIVIVDKPFILSDFVQPIQLCDYFIKVDEVCTHAGWGAVTKNNGLTASDYLMYHKLKGDSGGPLICRNKLCGVCSATVMDQSRTVNMFSNVIKAKGWIASNGTNKYSFYEY